MAPGMKLDHVGIHANQHLGCRLAADTAIHIRLFRKVFVKLPKIRDRIAHEYNAPGVGWLLLQLLVGLVIPAELIPILKLIRKALSGIEQAAIGIAAG